MVPDLVKTGDNTYVVSGDMNVFSLLEDLDEDARDFDSDYNTVGGWAMEMLGHIPEVGEKYQYKDLVITILVVEEQRILSLRVERIPTLQDMENEIKGR